MSATGHEGPPVGHARRRIGRIVVVTLVFTLGIQLGDAAFHAVQEVGNLPNFQKIDFGKASDGTDDRNRPPCLAMGGLSLDGLADRLFRFFRLGRTEDFATDRAPGYPAQD